MTSIPRIVRIQRCGPRMAHWTPKRSWPYEYPAPYR